jgi:hypothetical protein
MLLTGWNYAHDKQSACPAAATECSGAHGAPGGEQGQKRQSHCQAATQPQIHGEPGGQITAADEKCGASTENLFFRLVNP